MFNRWVSTVSSVIPRAWELTVCVGWSHYSNDQFLDPHSLNRR
jgi:hypothetical protein